MLIPRILENWNNFGWRHKELAYVPCILFRILQEALFPEYKSSKTAFRNSTVSQDDLILFGMHGHCDGVGRKLKIKPDYIEHHFPGKSLYVNGEPFGNVVEDYPTYDHLYQVGRVDGKRSIPFVSVIRLM